jgi:catechol 2,3-dioxygenase-like lactoylglutathione lyase family enzyme
MSMSLGLVSLYFQDLDRARAFYTETLGMAIAPEFTGPDFIFLALRGAALALRPISATLDGAQTGPGSVDISILVDDVDAAYADLTAKGVDIRTEIGDVGAGRAFFARDPEGHVIAFAQLYEQVLAGRAKYGV